MRKGKSSRTLEAGVENRRNDKRSLVIEVDKSNLQTVEIVRHVDETNLEAVDIDGAIVKPDLKAINIGVWCDVRKRDFKSIHRRRGVVEVHDQCGLNPKYVQFVGVDICDAGHLSADHIGEAVGDIEKARNRDAGEFLLGDVPKSAHIDAVHIAVMTEEDARTHAGD